MAQKKKPQRKVYVGVKNKRYTIHFTSNDELYHKSKSYYDNSSAARGARRHVKRENFNAEYV